MSCHHTVQEGPGFSWFDASVLAPEQKPNMYSHSTESDQQIQNLWVANAKVCANKVDYKPDSALYGGVSQ